MYSTRVGVEEEGDEFIGGVVQFGFDIKTRTDLHVWTSWMSVLGYISIVW